MGTLFKHYGLDWIATGFMLVSIYMLGNRRPSGFLVGMAANVAWVGFGVLVLSVANVVANVVLFWLNLRGWMRWRAEAAREAAAGGKPSAGGG